MRTTISSLLTLLALAGCSGDGPPVAGDDSGTPQQPSIEFGSTKVTSDENRSVLELPIQLSYALDETLVVPFVVSGSALEGHDVLVLTPSPVELAAGNLETKILLEIVEDEQSSKDGNRCDMLRGLEPQGGPPELDLAEESARRHRTQFEHEARDDFGLLAAQGDTR